MTYFIGVRGGPRHGYRLVKYGGVVIEICKRTDKQTDNLETSKQTDRQTCWWQYFSYRRQSNDCLIVWLTEVCQSSTTCTSLAVKQNAFGDGRLRPRSGTATWRSRPNNVVCRLLYKIMTSFTELAWLIELRFYVQLNTDVLPSWLSTEGNKPNTTEASNTKTKWPEITWKNTQK